MISNNQVPRLEWIQKCKRQKKDVFQNLGTHPFNEEAQTEVSLGDYCTL